MVQSPFKILSAIEWPYELFIAFLFLILKICVKLFGVTSVYSLSGRSSFNKLKNTHYQKLVESCFWFLLDDYQFLVYNKLH